MSCTLWVSGMLLVLVWKPGESARKICQGRYWEIFRVRFVFLTCALLVCSLTYAHSAERLSVGVVDDTVGWISIEEGQLSGELSKPYHCVFDHSGLEIEAISVSLSRGLLELELGRLDIMLPIARTSQRDEKADFAGPLYNDGFSIVSLRSLQLDGAFAEMPGLRYGIVLDFVGKQFIPESAVSIEEVSGWSQLVDMLKLQRIDVAVMPSGMAKRFLEREQEVLSSWEVGVIPVSLYISKKWRGTDVKRALRLAVQHCKTENTMNAEIVGESHSPSSM